MTVDAVSVLDGRRTARRFTEVEVELVAGDPDVLKTIARELRRVGARRHSGQPKVAAVLAEDGAPEESTAGAEATPQAQLQASFGAQYHAIVSHDPGVRLGDDPEDLHQLRVGTRRLRAMLRAARAMVDPVWADPLRAELAWLGGELGAVRDLDVLIGELEAEVRTLDPAEQRGLGVLLRRLEAERRDARQLLDAAMGSERYFALLDAVEIAANAPRFVGDEASVTDLARAEYRKLRQAVRGLGQKPPDDALHEARILCKRARYAAEVAEPVVGKAATRFVQRAKDLQDIIGEHQDAVVAEDELRRLAGLTRSSQAAVASGRLIERQRARKAARAPPRSEGLAPPRGRREAGLGLNEPVRAAGGVVVRERGGHREVLVVHRPRYDDWTLPKGKAKAGETDEECALREVEEETGLRCRLERELGSVSYIDARGRPEVRALLEDDAARRRVRSGTGGRRGTLAPVGRGLPNPDVRSRPLRPGERRDTRRATTRLSVRPRAAGRPAPAQRLRAHRPSQP